MSKANNRSGQPDPSSSLPDLSGKLYYTIGEVSELTGVKPHVLRYWESEFPSLRPKKDRGGSRRYRKRDIEEIHAIKSLLYEEGYRIAGAKQVLDQRKQGTPVATPIEQLAIGFDQLDPAAQVKQIREELTEILSLLQDAAPEASTKLKADQAEG